MLNLLSIWVNRMKTYFLTSFIWKTWLLICLGPGDKFTNHAVRAVSPNITLAALAFGSLSIKEKEKMGWLAALNYYSATAVKKTPTFSSSLS